jgi:hypothetical protein
MNMTVRVCCWAVLAAGCASAADTPATIGPPEVDDPSAASTSVAWFGFVGVSCSVDDPHDEAGPADYLDETKGFTNIAHVCTFELDMTDELAATRSAGVMAMLDVSALLWELVDGEAPSGSGRRYVLRGDAAASWADFADRNATVLDADHLAAIYLIDEPTWNGATPADLDRAAAIVEATHPDIPMMVIEAPDALVDAYFPDGVDWVGFDRYGTRDPNTDAAYLENVRALRSRTTEAQQHVVVMDTQWLPIFEQVGLAPDDMAEVARNYLRYAKAHPEVVAIIGYSWPGGIDGPDHLGARNLPQSVQQVYVDIGEAIVGD